MTSTRHRHELGGQVGGRVVAQDQTELHTRPRQPLDRDAQLRVQGTQRVGGRVVVLPQLGDPGQREPEIDEALDPQQPDQVGDAVLLVAV